MAKSPRGPGNDKGPVLWMFGDGNIADLTYQGLSLRNWITGVELMSDPRSAPMARVTMFISQLRIVPDQQTATLSAALKAQQAYLESTRRLLTHPGISAAQRETIRLGLLDLAREQVNPVMEEPNEPADPE